MTHTASRAFPADALDFSDDPEVMRLEVDILAMSRMRRDPDLLLVRGDGSRDWRPREEGACPRCHRALCVCGEAEAEGVVGAEEGE